MTRALILILALTGCTNVREAVNCDNAAKVRAAAQLTLQAIDRACPIVPAENLP